MFGSLSKHCVNEYHRHIRRGRIFTIIFAISSILLAVASTSVGKYPIGILESYEIIFNHLQGIDPVGYVAELKDFIVWDRNLPRAVAGLTVGAILAIGGAVMQSMMKNPLADSYTTGISSGALFGVTVWLVMGISVVPAAGTYSQTVSYTHLTLPTIRLV